MFPSLFICDSVVTIFKLFSLCSSKRFDSKELRLTVRLEKKKWFPLAANEIFASPSRQYSVMSFYVASKTLLWFNYFHSEKAETMEKTCPRARRRHSIMSVNLAQRACQRSSTKWESSCGGCNWEMQREQARCKCLYKSEWCVNS